MFVCVSAVYAHESFLDPQLAEGEAERVVAKDVVKTLEMRVAMVEDMLECLQTKIANVTVGFLRADSENELNVFARYALLSEMYASVANGKLELQREVIEAKGTLIQIELGIQKLENVPEQQSQER
jgi:predicted ATPase